jgi:hypothetical protein
MVWTHTIQTDTGGMAGGMASDSHSICVRNRQAAATGVPAVLGRTDTPPPSRTPDTRGKSDGRASEFHGSLFNTTDR